MADSQFMDLHFPLAGIDRSSAFDRQPARKLTDGNYGRTSYFGKNVRTFEPTTDRARGGMRPGLSRYVDARVSGSNLLQAIAAVSGVGYDAPGGDMQSSQSGRLVTLVAVSGGNVKITDAGGTEWTTPTNGAAALNSTGVVFAAANNQKLWFADGVNWKYYDPATNAVLAWTASVGTLPVDEDDNAPRLICTWRGRTVLSGLLKDGQNVFLSRVGDPTNFDYAPVSPGTLDAVAFNSSPFGLVGDVVTCLIPASDDVLLIGGDHSIYQLRGDPMLGGQLDLVSDAIGMAWGEPWCKDPYGVIYFVSNRMGIYAMQPGRAPERISKPIEQLLKSVNTGSNTIRLLWDDRYQGMHVFVSATAAPTANTHLFWEARVNAWWTDVFGDNNFNPLSCCVFDGNTPDDRVSLIGSWDGYVRYLDPGATTDDGEEITSIVWIGPLTTKDLDELMLHDMQAVLGEQSGDIEYAIHVGTTAEQALTTEAVDSGTWTAGRNFTHITRRAGHAIYVKLTATTPWALETVRARVAALGKIRRRG